MHDHIILFLSIFLFASSALPARAELDVSIVPAPDAEGKWGYVDAASGKTLIAPQFSDAGFFYDGAAIVKRADHEKTYTAKTIRGETVRVIPEFAGIINRDGEEILPLRYEVYRADSGGNRLPRLFLVRTDEGELGALHAGKGWIVPPGAYKNISFTSDGAVLCDGAHYTPDGLRVNPPSGCEVAWQEKKTGMFRVRKKGGGPEGVMRPDGSLLVPVEYNEIKAMPEAGIWLASRGDSAAKGKLLLAYMLGKGIDVDDGEDIAATHVYDASGAKLRSFRSRYYPSAAGDIYEYLSEGREYRVNARTGELLPEKSDYEADGKGFRIFKEKKLYGIKDARDQVTVPPEYEEIASLGGGLFSATRKMEYYVNNHGLIDGNGKVILPFIYGGIESCSYPTRKNGPLLRMTWGSPSAYQLIDRSGRALGEHSYENQFYFNAAGQAVVWRGHKYGLIDHTGREVLPCAHETVFDEITLRETRQGTGTAPKSASVAPKEALYIVERDNLWGIYDGTGKELVPIRYGYVTLDNMPQGWARVENPGRTKRGVVNWRSGQVIEPVYDSVMVYQGFFIAYIYGGNKDVYIVLDKKGKETARYDRAEWLENAAALVAKKDGKYAMMNEEGKPLTPFRYENMFKAEGPFLWAWPEDGNKILLNGKGREYTIK